MPRLLLIDDDVLVRKVLAFALVGAGHVVVEAADGREGLSCFRAEPADLIITDLVMPDHEGIETIMTLRREWPALPIIAMSGHPACSAIYLDLARKLGAQRTLTKPFALDALLRAIDELLPPGSEPPARQ